MSNRVIALAYADGAAFGGIVYLITTLLHLHHGAGLAFVAGAVLTTRLLRKGSSDAPPSTSDGDLGPLRK